MVNFKELLGNNNQLQNLLLDTVEEGEVYRSRRKLHYLLKASEYEFLGDQDRFVDCSDFKRISKERFAELFSIDNMKGKINKNDLVEIKKAVCSYENVSMKLLKRFGLII